MYGHNDVAMWLLEQPNIMYNLPDTYDGTKYLTATFSLACANCSIAVIERFMQFADVKTEPHGKIAYDEDDEDGITIANGVIIGKLNATIMRLARMVRPYTDNDFYCACSAGDLPLVKTILEATPTININSLGHDKYTASMNTYTDQWHMYSCLGIACRNGHNDVVLYLLGLPNIDYNGTVFSTASMAPLAIACLYCNAHVIRRFLAIPLVSFGNYTTKESLKRPNYALVLTVIRHVVGKLA
jgi:hypothetical protein